MARHPAMQCPNGGQVRTRCPNVLVYAALVAAQISWASALIVHRIGLHGISPILFCVVREALATPILLALAALSARDTATGRRRSIWVGKNFWQFGVTGLFIFGDQLFTLLGIKLTDATSCAAWQPSICVFATAISCSLGWESLTKRKFVGIATTVVGSLIMVLLEFDGSHSSHNNQQGLKIRLFGQLCFLCNCMSSASLYVYSKKVLNNVGAIELLAWSYACCAVFMLVANLSISGSGTLHFICDDCSGGSWHMPRESLWAVCYSVIFASCLAYFLTLWANGHVHASTSSQFLTVQPLAAIMLQCTLIFFHLNPNGVLTLPGKNVLGGVPVVLGLVISNSGQASDNEHHLDVVSSGYTSDNDRDPDSERPTVCPTAPIGAVKAPEEGMPVLPR